MAWLVRTLRLPAAESHTNLALAICVFLMGLMSVAIIWQAQVIANQQDEPMESMPIEPRSSPPAGSPAPPPASHNGPAHWIKVSAQQDGTFTVTNTRNGFSKTYRSSPR